MTNLKPLNELNAPEVAREVLGQAKKNYGFIPNLLGNMAHAPALLKAYLSVGALFDQTSLSPTERQVVLLTVSAQNGCEYCVAAHTAIAGMQKVPQDVVQAIRTNEPIADGKLETLRDYTREVVERRGWPSAAASARFEAAGYTSEQALEVVLGVGMKTLSNYTNHFAKTPLDRQFASAAWEPAAAVKG
ncbi:MAG: carboxymuconolactone decarboxylase family protein [Acidobacteria bacterium]|nr:carboxymuconolactone decarboxylase family protein [Acidobacteriota bacterium]